jgi:DNA-binding CsgD family transcriptional regulator
VARGCGGSLSVAIGVCATQRPEGDDDPEQELAGIGRSGQDHGERPEQEGETPDDGDLPVESPESRAVTGVGAKPFMTHVEADLATFGLPSAPKSVSRSTLDLTDRERDVAVLVAQGMSNPEVADRLYVSRKAIEFHLGNIYGKLGITSRRELRSKQFSF